MIISNITVTTINMNETERNALEITLSVLSRIHDTIPEDGEMVSMETGEVIEKSELPRTLGIISGALANHIWEMR